MEVQQIDEYIQLAIEKVVFYLPRLVFAALIIWIGFVIVNRIIRSLRKTLKKSGFSDNFRPFITSMISVFLKLVIVYIAAYILGADLTGFIAILAAAGFAIGLALQGSLGNFASGILILTFNPYRIGDWIQVDDKFGKVTSIGIFSTDVMTPGNKILIIPNSMITESVVTNYSEQGNIRLELMVAMPYEESYPKVEKIIRDALAEIPLVLKEPQPEIGIHTFDTHFIQLIVRPYVEPDEYWATTFHVHRAIKQAFHQHNIKMAYSEGVELGPIGE